MAACTAACTASATPGGICGMAGGDASGGPPGIAVGCDGGCELTVGSHGGLFFGLPFGLSFALPFFGLGSDVGVGGCGGMTGWWDSSDGGGTNTVGAETGGLSTISQITLSGSSPCPGRRR